MPQACPESCGQIPAGPARRRLVLVARRSVPRSRIWRRCAAKSESRVARTVRSAVDMLCGREAWNPPETCHEAARNVWFEPGPRPPGAPALTFSIPVGSASRLIIPKSRLDDAIVNKGGGGHARASRPISQSHNESPACPAQPSCLCGRPREVPIGQRWARVAHKTGASTFGRIPVAGRVNGQTNAWRAARTSTNTSSRPRSPPIWRRAASGRAPWDCARLYYYWTSYLN